MANRLMTPFCFASLLAAALIAEGALVMPAAKPAPLPADPEAWILPVDAVGGLETDEEGALTGGYIAAWE